MSAETVLSFDQISAAPVLAAARKEKQKRQKRKDRLDQYAAQIYRTAVKEPEAVR